MATLDSRPERADLGRDVQRSLTKGFPREIPPTVSARSRQAEYQITDDTEISLDGRPCKYRDVPANAVILKMEVATEKTVLKRHFRTRR
jgi:hypothetical protein